MKRSRRLFSLPILSGAFALILCVVLAASCGQSTQNKKQTPAVAGAGANPASFIPVGMDFMLRVDWTQIVKSMKQDEQFKKEFKTKIEQTLRSKDPILADIFQALDIDPLTDIQGLATGAVINSENPDEGDVLFALKSKLTLDKIVSVLKDKAAAKMEIASLDQDGVKGYTIAKAGGAAGDKVYVTSKDDVILAASKTSMLTEALATERSGKSAFSTGKLSEGLPLIDNKAQAVLVLDGTKLPKDKRRAPPIPGAENMQLLAASLNHANAQYDLVLNSRFSDPKTAQALSQQLLGFKGMLAASKDLAPMLDKVVIAAQEADLRITASITDQQIEELQKQMEQQMGQRMLGGQRPAPQMPRDQAPPAPAMPPQP